MSPPVLVLGYGNPARGDDGLGPALLQRLAPHVDPGRVELLEDFQLQIEHALDLVGRRLVIFVDAAVSGPGVGLQAAVPQSHDPGLSHALSPGALLSVYRRIHHRAPPPAFVLALGGEAFALGAPLSPSARRHLAAGTGLALALCRDPDPVRWRVACRRGAPVREAAGG